MANDPTRKAQILPSRLALIRSELGWKQSDFAERLSEMMGVNVSSQSVSLWETQRRPVPEKYYDAICQLFKCTLSYLCGLSNDSNSEAADSQSEEYLGKIEISESHLYKYNREPIFVEFINKTHADAWGLYDARANQIVFTDWNMKLNNFKHMDIKLYKHKPSYIMAQDLSYKKSLDFVSMLALDRVYIEINSSDPYIRGLYNGWYKHDCMKNCLMKTDTNLTLSYNGLGISYKAFSPNTVISQ